MGYLDPNLTYQLLLVIQAAHLLHHRISKRHISFVEGFTAVVLCILPSWNPFGIFLPILHLVLAIVQISGSLFIRKLSPNWKVD